MTYKDAEMLQNAMGGFTDTMLRIKMLKQEQENSKENNLYRHQEQFQRNNEFSQDMDLRKQELDARIAQANQKQAPTITAYIADPDKPGEGMQFTGTPEQFDSIKQIAQKNFGKAPLVMPKPPSSVQHEVASYTIGGATHKFYTQAAADEFEKALKEQGIDPTKVTTQTDETVSGKVDPSDTSKVLPPVTTKRTTTKGDGVPRTIGGSGLPDLSPQAAKPAPTPKDVSYLAAHPEMKDKFEARFGAGSADKYLP